VIGLLLVPPLLVKMASVSWRFLRYYRHAEAYRHKAAPPTVLRILGPLLLLATLVLIVSGITLLLAPSAFGGPHGTMYTIHAGSFYIWMGLVLVHVLAHARDLRGLAAKDWLRRTRTAVPGALARQLAVLASLAAGLALALSLVGYAGTFQNTANHPHGASHLPNTTRQAGTAAHTATITSQP
jgi:nicotinamide mononucleotide (NMN) deamidase PncC